MVVFFIFQDSHEKESGRFIIFFSGYTNDLFVEFHSVFFVFDVLCYHFFQVLADVDWVWLRRRYTRQLVTTTVTTTNIQRAPKNFISK